MKKIILILSIMVGASALAVDLHQGQVPEDVLKISKQDIILDKKGATETVFVYSDAQCPYCRKGLDSILDIQTSGDARIRIVYRNLPLDFHKSARKGARTLQAVRILKPKLARAFLDHLHENQEELDSDFDTLVERFSKKNGINNKKLLKLAVSTVVVEKVEADISQAHALGIKGTPSFIINGEILMGAYPRETLLEKILD